MGAQITSGGYVVGLNDYGTLLDDLFFGYVRPDIWDPFGNGDSAIGAPRDVWGISAGSSVGWYDVDPALDGPPTNITANGSPTYGASTASMSWFLKPASTNLIQLDYAISFAAVNVLKSAITITNVSGSTQNPVKYRRLTEFKITDAFSSPDNIVTIDSNPTSLISAASPYVYGPGAGVFQPISPLTAMNATTTGGTTPFGDLGSCMDINIGSMANNAATTFNIYHAISTIGQTEAQLRSQLTALGASFIISDNGPPDAIPAVPVAAAVAFQLPSTPGSSVVPRRTLLGAFL